ncbi:MAG: hypothetical protein ACM3X1_07175 [Ignavibacteriales bacterium]
MHNYSKYPDSVAIYGIILQRDSIIALLSNTDYFNQVRNRFENYNKFTVFNPSNKRHNFYVIRDNGEYVMVRSLIDLAIFSNGYDGWGAGWHSNDYNLLLLHLGFTVYHDNDIDYSSNSIYKKSIEEGLFVYRKAE